MADFHAAYDHLVTTLGEQGLDLATVKTKLKAQQIETPSWGYADSGTRFGVFYQPGAAMTIQEKIDDAAQVHKFTGIAPAVAVHVLWDFDGDDMEAVKDYAESRGVRIGAINPNCFQDQEYKIGSIANPDPAIRKRAVQHMLDSIEIGKAVDSKVLSLWFADGTNYPGQADFIARKHWVQESLQTVYQALPPDMRMLIEYKLFEPGFYHTDIADWGMAYVFARKCGPQAQVLVDLGHHAHGVNIEHLVAFLIDEGQLGGFHFNNRRYADDDLTVCSVNPYEVFLIYNELAKAEEYDSPPDVAYMVDQSHNLKPKIEAMIQTICNLQTCYAKALIVDRRKLAEAQGNGDIVGAENVLLRAFNTDVEPLLQVVREEMGLNPDPLQAYRAGGYYDKIARERGIRTGGGGLG